MQISLYIYTYIIYYTGILKKLQYPVGYAIHWLCCPSPFWQQKGVDTMDTILTNFLVAVAAQVAAHFLCKWLESHRKGK